MKTTILLAALGISVVGGTAGSLSGCGSSVPPPNDAWAAAQTAIGRAQAGGSDGVPDAKLQLQLAVEDLRHAKSLIGVDNARATTLCAVSNSEAQLALSLANQAKADADAKAAEDALNQASQR
jgi:hypothetical protein